MAKSKKIKINKKIVRNLKKMVEYFYSKAEDFGCRARESEEALKSYLETGEMDYEFKELYASELSE